MPSTEYYRRQAETLLALASGTNDPALSALCQCLAMEYGELAQKIVGEPLPARSTSTSRVTSIHDSA
jgi:hypothetical protein